MSAVLPPLTSFQVQRYSRVTEPPPGVRATARTATVSSSTMSSALSQRRATSVEQLVPNLASSYTTTDKDGNVFNHAHSAEVRTTLRDSQKLKIVSFVTVTPASSERVSYSFVVSPNEVSTSRVGIVYSEISRPGRKPFLRSSSINLKQITITVMVVNSDRSYISSAQREINALEALGNLDYDVSLFYSGISPATRWRITDVRIKAMRRNASNNVSIAEADLTFTEAAVMPSIVPGMPKIKDVPQTRNSKTNPGATDEKQRGSDADAIKAIIDAGGGVTSPGTSGGGA